MLRVALKEWAAVCHLLLEGRQSILLRKGGILEPGGPGRFEPEHQRFGLFPAWAHQKPAMMAQEHAQIAAPMAEPQRVRIEAVATVERIWRVADRRSLDRLEGLHGWQAPYLDMRWGYKPANPLYLMALRVGRLVRPVEVVNDLEYSGCRSWVALREADALEDEAARPVLAAGALEKLIERLDRALSSA